MRKCLFIITVLITTLLVSCTPGNIISYSPSTTHSFDETVSNAITTTNHFWADRFTGPTKFQTPPIYSYDSSDDLSCNRSPVKMNNAVYCGAGSFIAFDVNFLRKGFEQYGKVFIYFIISHEYGHAAQDTLRIPFDKTKEFELQADCLSGAYFSDAQTQGFITLSQHDIEQLRLVMYSFGDDTRGGTPPHGTGEERYEALYRGYYGTVAECLPNMVWDAQK